MLKKSLGVAFLLTVCYFPLFFHLDSLPIQTYDESRLAINALEMAENGNVLVTSFGGKPDMWNTKPPLMIWLQVLGYKIVGYGELGARLPAALAALITVLFIGFFCWKKLSRSILAICSIGVLLTTPGYIGSHVSRTADYDALLILFTTLFLFTFFQFIHAEQQLKKRRLLYFSTLWLSLAVLTKGIAGLLFLPAILIYTIFSKQLVNSLKSKDTYLAIGLFLVLVFSYYVLREQYNPGYLEAVWENELGGRYFDTLENHKAPFKYYFENLWDRRLGLWKYILPLGVVAVFFEKGQVRQFAIFLLIAVSTYLLIVSSANTKLEWYDAPVFPLLAIITALGLEKIVTFLASKIKLNPVYIVIILFAFPYFKMVKSIYKEPVPDAMHHYGLFMKDIPEYKEYAIVNVSYGAHINFYQKVFNRKGYKIRTTWPSGLNIGETAMLCEKEPIRVLNERFEYETLEEGWGCLLVKVLAKKE